LAFGVDSEPSLMLSRWNQGQYEGHLGLAALVGFPRVQPAKQCPYAHRTEKPFNLDNEGGLDRPDKTNADTQVHGVSICVLMENLEEHTNHSEGLSKFLWVRETLPHP